MLREPLQLLTLPSTRTTALLLACLAATAVAGGVVGVPDARITVDTVAVDPSEPVVGERTAVNVTVASSAGSAEPANVSELRLLDADGETHDVAAAPGALSPGDDLDATLWTTFDDPGEHRLTVEVTATEPVDDADEDSDPPVVRVQRDVVVDVEPAETAVDLRVRPLSPADLREDDGDAEGVDVGGVGGIDGLLGGGGGGLEAGSDEGTVDPMASPVAVTVVNTGTVVTDRVSVTASGIGLEDSDADEPSDVGDADAGEAANGTEAPVVDAGPFVVEDVAPGEERRVVLDLGPLDRRSNVTVTAAFRSSAGSPDGEGASGTAESDLSYPPRDGRPTITGASVTHEGTDRVVVDANLANTGDAEIEGVVVDVTAADGVAGTADGESYFVGVVGESDFVPFEIHAAANASVADTVPLRIEYTDRGVRYVETVALDLPPPPDDGSDGRFAGVSGAGIGPIGLGVGTVGVVGTVGAVGIAVATVVIRRRDV